MHLGQDIRKVRDRVRVLPRYAAFVRDNDRRVVFGRGVDRGRRSIVPSGKFDFSVTVVMALEECWYGDIRTP